MRDAAAVFQLFAAFLFAGAAVRVLRLPRGGMLHPVTLAVFGSFLSVLAMVNLFNFLRTANVTAVFEPYEGYVEIIAFPLALFVLYSIRTDLSRRRLARLQEEERMRAMLLDSVGDTVILHTKSGEIRYMNRNGHISHGLAPQAVSGVHLHDLLAPEARHATMEQLGRVTDDQGLTFESLHRRADGTEFPVEVRARAYTYQGQATILSVVRDLSERQRLERERESLTVRLQQAQRMESLGTLAGGIAHDFNNILVPIMGYSDLLAMRFPKGSQEHDSATKIAQAAERAKEIIHQLLSFTRSRDESDSARPVFPHRVLKEVLTLVGEVLPSTVRLESDLSPTLPVIATEARLHRVFMNLITNAWQALRGQPGTVRIGLQEIPPVTGSGARWVEIRVGDTGCGMTKAERERIFEPYFTTKADGVGTGLGLSVVDGIVREAGGRIEVHSAPGEGTEFVVQLPSAPVEESVLPAAPVDAEIPRSGHVMVVDDEPVIVEYLEEVLVSEGFTVAAFSDSPSALAAFEAQPGAFDVVLSDYTMPQMTGEELARRMRRIRADVPFLLCSGFSGQISRERYQELRISGFLLKPVRPAELIAGVRRALAKAPGNPD